MIKVRFVVSLAPLTYRRNFPERMIIGRSRSRGGTRGTIKGHLDRPASQISMRRQRLQGGPTNFSCATCAFPPLLGSFAVFIEQGRPRNRKNSHTAAPGSRWFLRWNNNAPLDHNEILRLTC